MAAKVPSSRPDEWLGKDVWVNLRRAHVRYARLPHAQKTRLEEQAQARENANEGDLHLHPIPSLASNADKKVGQRKMMTNPKTCSIL